MSCQQVAKARPGQAKPTRKSAAAVAVAAVRRSASVSAAMCWVSAANRSQQAQSAHQSASALSQPQPQPHRGPGPGPGPGPWPGPAYACFLVSLRLPEVSCKCNLLGAAIATVDVAALDIAAAAAATSAAAAAAPQRVMSIWQTNCRPFEAYSATVYSCYPPIMICLIMLLYNAKAKAYL